MVLDTLKMLLNKLVDKGNEIEDKSIDMRSFLECLQEARQMLEEPKLMIEMK